MTSILPAPNEDAQVFEASLRDLSQRLSLVIERVSNGHLAVITDHGKMIALLTQLDSQMVIVRDGRPVALLSEVDGKLVQTEIDVLTMRDIGQHSGLVKERAKRRKPIVITKHGRPVAMVTYISQEVFDAALRKALLELLLPSA